MSLGAIGAAAIAGWFTGSLLFVSVLRWSILVAEARSQATRSDNNRGSWRSVVPVVVAQSLFHSAPWLILVLGFVGYEVHSEKWAPWLLLGFFGTISFLGALAGVSIMHIRKRQKNAA